MFDPAVWSSESFVDAVPIVAGERRIITMTVPSKLAVAITSVYVFNADNADHDVRLELTGDPPRLAAPFISVRVMSAFAQLLLPVDVGADQVSRVQTPFLINGPILFTIQDLFPLASPFATMIFTINWLEAKFPVLASTPIVPVGVTV